MMLHSPCPKQALKVLIVQPKMHFYGGAELLIVRLVQFLSGNDVETTVLTASISSQVREALGDTPILVMHDAASHAPPGAMQTLGFLFSRIREISQQFDLINIHNYPAELAVFCSKRPVVWMCNEPLEVGLKARLPKSEKWTPKGAAFASLLRLDRWMVRRRITQAVVADRFNRDRFVRIYGFEPAIIPYGVDVDFFSQPSPGAASRRSPNHFTVLQVGVISPYKNQMASLRAIQAVRDKIPNIRLILAGHGEGDYFNTIKDVIRKESLEPFVEITGHVDRRRLREWYRSADVLLHPIGPQGGWLAPFEALSAGLSIVVSKEMTVSSVIEGNNLGIVTADFGDALLALYSEPSGHFSDASRRIEWVKEHLSWERFSGQMLRVFENACKIGGNNRKGCSDSNKDVVG